jgi:hypothetical protein
MEVSKGRKEMTLDERIREADKAGLSYGRYCATQSGYINDFEQRRKLMLKAQEQKRRKRK